jgi:hypothetical protein
MQEIHVEDCDSSRSGGIPFEPLPDEVVVRLRSDRTTAFAAALIVAHFFPDIVSWAARAVCKPADPLPRSSGGNGSGPSKGVDAPNGRSNCLR